MTYTYTDDERASLEARPDVAKELQTTGMKLDDYFELVGIDHALTAAQVHELLDKWAKEDTEDGTPQAPVAPVIELISVPVLRTNAEDEATVDALVRQQQASKPTTKRRLVEPVEAVDIPEEPEEEEVDEVTVIQTSLIGAMQRAHPALTELWLQWTGIPDLEHATFDTARPEEAHQEPATRVTIGITPKYQTTWTALCDTLGLPPNAKERRQNPMHLAGKSYSHQSFWSAMRRRELQEVDGPLEWWWQLLVLRCRGVRAASRLLLGKLFGDEPELDSAVINFVNPTLKTEGRRAKDVVDGGYRQPSTMIIGMRVNRRSLTSGLAYPLDGDKVRTHFITTLLDTAVSRDLHAE